MKKIDLSQTDLDLLRRIAHNQKLLDDPEQYPLAKVYDWANMPIKKHGSSTGGEISTMIYGAEDEYFTKNDIYSLYDWCMIEISPHFHLTVIGQAYLDYLLQCR